MWEQSHRGVVAPIVRCPCQTAEDRERRRQYLQRIDGLKPKERLLRFEDFHVTPVNRDAYEAVYQAVRELRGLVTLTGHPGTGKTALLICAINAARERGVPAVYTTVTDLLDYLRRAYDPSATVSFDSRWELLTSAEVLALDELDEFNTTPWAIERFLRLMDERWRMMDRLLTLCATNSELDALPLKVASRLRDGRGTVIRMGGPDMRPAMRW